jgi:hypothetical protein
MTAELKALPKPKFLLLPETVGLPETTDYALRYAHELMIDPITDKTCLYEEIMNLPAADCNRIHETVSDSVTEQVHGANEFIDIVRTELIHVLAGDLTIEDDSDADLFLDDEKDIDIGVFAQRSIIEQERHPENPVLMDMFVLINTFLHEQADESAHTQGLSARSYKTAISHVGAELAAWMYTYAHEEQDKELLHLWLSHFALVSGVLVGARTNAALMAFYPDQFPPQITRDIHILALADEESDLARIYHQAIRNFYSREQKVRFDQVSTVEGGSYMRLGGLMLCALNPAA